MEKEEEKDNHSHLEDVLWTIVKKKKKKKKREATKNRQNRYWSRCCVYNMSYERENGHFPHIEPIETCSRIFLHAHRWENSEQCSYHLHHLYFKPNKFTAQ